MKAAILPDRGVIKVAGEEARPFLNGLLTTDISQVTPASPRFAALLTPQGKIIADFIISEHDGAFLLDCPRPLAQALADRLKFYKLRAKVTIEDISATTAVLALWDGARSHGHQDPRLDALGRRTIAAAHDAARTIAALGATPVDAEQYDAHRIALGVPRGGLDFAYGDAFPHEADMDQLNGIDFDKGCYVGQEVVSRTEHRGIARNRVVPVETDGRTPPAGVPVMAGGKQVGLTGSGLGRHGLAMLRLDRIADAHAAGAPLIADGITLKPVKPGWARFDVPGAETSQ